MVVSKSPNIFAAGGTAASRTGNGIRLIEPTRIRLLVFLLVSLEQPCPNDTRSKAI
ncbi:hypothetical protein QMA80_03440 [Burkholderia pseudomallei]|uniref:hypothetical protein n=1 Tax=Burkholderia pseudomallei TaxID=28450 RepID=UPI002DBDEF89|nr:hypothetical protein [Burkholderia pseudomallei]MEB5496003.1 hypothetical protein [Burkholderia pseudomallei]MEB5509546.1 hypothetical protein [Burkholderia pseudomallei]